MQYQVGPGIAFSQGTIVCNELYGKRGTLPRKPRNDGQKSARKETLVLRWRVT
jgi:hypothetical protein